MKKLLVLVACFMSTMFAVQAQDTAAKKPSLKQELSLTPEQATQVKAINDKIKAKIEGIDAEPSLDEAAKKAKKKELSTAKIEMINGVLTDEQKVKYKALLEKQKAEREAAKKAKG